VLLSAGCVTAQSAMRLARVFHYACCLLTLLCSFEFSCQFMNNPTCALLSITFRQGSRSLSWLATVSQRCANCSSQSISVNSIWWPLHLGGSAAFSQLYPNYCTTFAMEVSRMQFALPHPSADVRFSASPRHSSFFMQAACAADATAFFVRPWVFTSAGPVPFLAPF